METKAKGVEIPKMAAGPWSCPPILLSHAPAWHHSHTAHVSVCLGIKPVFAVTLQTDMSMRVTCLKAFTFTQGRQPFSVRRHEGSGHLAVEPAQAKCNPNVCRKGYKQGQEGAVSADGDAGGKSERPFNPLRSSWPVTETLSLYSRVRVVDGQFMKSEAAAE